MAIDKRPGTTRFSGGRPLAERAGRLKSMRFTLSGHYSVEVVGEGEGFNAGTVLFEHSRRQTVADKIKSSCELRSLQSDWSAEAPFRALKSEPGLIPAFRQLGGRTGSHLPFAATARHFWQAGSILSLNRAAYEFDTRASDPRGPTEGRAINSC
ncbi:MAG: hypothetical protein OXI01_00775 [Albidovulum sp.]|nr:hypothetical protein [Albidovulum sp.]